MCRQYVAGVDPRMRGGDKSRGRCAVLTRGRSPHARGRHSNESQRSFSAGSIPACAGETGTTHFLIGPPRVDPRMRGGDITVSLRRVTRWGRSPHARGRRPRRWQGLGQPGSIPACAGETRPLDNIPLSYRVDPRMRGGDRPFADRVRWDQGRSPHARGRPSIRRSGSMGSGSIPACAGETL